MTDVMAAAFKQCDALRSGARLFIRVRVA